MAAATLSSVPVRDSPAPGAPSTAAAPNAAAGGECDAVLSREDLLLSHSAQEAVANQLASFYLAALAFVAACRSPAVLRSLKRAAKPLLISALAQYAALMALLAPVHLTLRLVAWATSTQRVAFSSHRVVAGSLAVYPLITILLAKFVYRRSLAECFFEALGEVDPQHAQRLASNEPTHKRTLKDKMLGMVTDDADDPWRMLALLLVASLLRSWRWVRMGVLRYVIVPLAQFLSIRYMVGRPWAAGVLTAAACLLPAVEPLVMDFVEVWASSRALGQSSMRHFLERAIPKGRHAAFVRTFESVIVTYFILPTLLMRLPAGPLGPFLGPLLVFPAAAVAARCVHDITSRAGSDRVVRKLAGAAE
ncbi:MAG: hypothetical protein J3K34DRAFT_401559 [Monoraphidium minutum]|nr:MAG: hypothetical protein J3K34DRAFT_401559 [Monoraphidium minutum]